MILSPTDVETISRGSVTESVLEEFRIENVSIPGIWHQLVYQFGKLSGLSTRVYESSANKNKLFALIQRKVTSNA